MNNIENAGGKSAFFPETSKAKIQRGGVKDLALKRNSTQKTDEINKNSSEDAKVDISDAIKDFSRIKMAVDASEERDNSAKIEDLKKRIEAGAYKVDYEALADKIIGEEFS